MDDTVDAVDGEEPDADGGKHPDSDDAEPNVDADEEMEEPGVDTTPAKGVYSKIDSPCCGTLPHTVHVSAFLSDPANMAGRSAEAKYAQEYVRRLVGTKQDIRSLTPLSLIHI